MAHIRTYARLKPTKKPFGGYSVSKNMLTIPIPDNKDHLMAQNSQPIRSSVTYDIHFDNIFLPEATQEDVFEDVAKDIIKNFLNGYNGTIFVYGQTGTGKTYTMEGNACQYQTRGLTTRALAMIYQELEKRTDEHISVYLSFLEIYQEVAYDLLNPASRTMLPVMPFAKVTVVEGPGGSCILRGLSLHLAANEDVAQMLLLQGQANRKVAETPVNQRSSRSHAVFTVYLQARKKDSQVILSSKLHLVDLAGSERVSKTGVDGQQLSEAKSINLSLHHLETVIIFLQDGHHQKAPKGDVNSSLSRCSNPSFEGSSYRISTRHIPYRNSLLTMILKDSLGGNCLTAMIATLSLDPENLGESISTCRFAQRVARVANFARRNEEIDDKMLIKKLKMRVAQLETQVALLMTKSSTDVDSSMKDTEDSFVSEEEIVDCQQVVEEFLQGIINDPVSAGICTEGRFRKCLLMMKSRMLEQGILSTKTANTPPPSEPQPVSGPHFLLQNDRDVLTKKQEECFALSSEKASSMPSQEIPVQEGFINLQTSTLQEIAKSPTKSSLNGEKHQQDVKLNRKENLSPTGERKMDSINILLAETSPSHSKANSYKSPFERKREKEIKKLGKKLFSIEEEKAAREEELEMMKQDTVLNSLRMEEDGLNLKLQVADEQVADQHAYILHLKHIECDPDLLSQEVLVEKQLQKRQMKFQSKLDDIQERRIGVEKELSQMAQEKGKFQSEKKTVKSFEDRYGQYRQNKGSLNTRQVYEMLKSEEKRQKKEVGKVEREKTLMKTKQLELKEMATWEKLRELKQMLKVSQQQEQDNMQRLNYTELLGTGQSMSSNDLSPVVLRGQNSVKASDEFRSCDDDEDLDVDKASISNGQSFPAFPHSQIIIENMQYVQYKNDSQFVEDKESESRNTPLSDDRETQPWAFFLSQNASDVPPTTAKPGTSVNLGENQIQHSKLDPRPSEKFSDLGRNKHSVGILNDTDFSVIHDDSAFTENGQNLIIVKKDENNNSKHGQTDGDSNLTLDFTDLEEGGWGLTQTNSPLTSDLVLKKSFNNKSSPFVNMGCLDSETLKKESNSSNLGGIMETLNPSAIQSNSNRIEEQDYTSHMVKTPTRVLPPSEYINSMTDKERFDARRMGLSSRTFESALSHMLKEVGVTGNNNVPDLPYSVDLYEKYERKSTVTHHQSQKQPKTLKKNSSHSAANTSKESSSRHKQTNATDRKKKVLEERSTWGPDIKNISIADRLNGLFDETPEKFLPSHNKAKPQTSGKRVNQSFEEDNSFHLGIVGVEHESDGVIVDDFCNEDDSFFGQQTPRSAVTALKKEEGEKAFMTRIASERERIAKIRKARHAAEVIQKHWRKFRTK